MNNMKPKYLIVLLLIILNAYLLKAQDRLTLNLAAARVYALEHNKNMKSAGYAIDKAEYALREAIANGLPQVNASVDYSNAMGAVISIRFAEGMPPTEIDIKPQSNLYLDVGQLIFSGNYIVGIQTARLYRELSQLNHEKTELEVIAQITDAYYLVLISEQFKNLMEQNLANLSGLYEKTAVLEHVGIIEKTDLDQLWIQVNTLQNALKSTERQLELTTNMLRLQLGAGVDTEIELTDSLDDLIAEAGFENFIMQQFHSGKSIDFRMMQQQELISEKMVNMRRANALPTLTAFYRHTYKVLKPDFDMTPANMIGLQLSVPIFSSGVRHYQTRQAIVDLKTTRNNMELLNDQLLIQEKQLRFNFNNALETYNNQKNNVEVSRRVYQSLKLKYEQGMISGLDLITADNNYLRAETDYISAKMQVLTSRLQLEKLYGEIQ
jgi:outer membrane protein